MEKQNESVLILFAKKCVKDACITLGDCEEERNSQKESRMRLAAQIWGEKIEKCEGFVEFCVKLLRMYTSAKEIGLI